MKDADGKYINSAGGRIKAARLSKGMTQAQLAERLGVRTMFISDIECDRRNPSLEWLWNASRAMDYDASELDPRLRSFDREVGGARPEQSLHG